MLEIEVEDRAALRLLDNIGDRLEHPDGLLGALVEEMHDYERDVFATSGHGAWPALSPNTLRQKSGGQVLVDSGDLLHDLTSSKDLLGDEASVTTDADHARFHRYGTSRMPRRDPTPTPPSHVVEEWARTALDYITDGRL
ncbi:hypothetical protein [Nocardioides sp.]|uniref:hypothetical protein n=1 Tax=Nocardioides sp. TaxID=35761 RepID=UPI002617BC69|nr:hypothetical protein [Nocardioides sp.]MDI6911478.1 hypothetical protein [Nocardioides sp.]